MNATPTFSCYGPTTEAEGTCFTTLNGSCITDGPGNYGNNECCTIEVLRDTYLYVSGPFVIWSLLESKGADYFTVNDDLKIDENGFGFDFENLYVTAGTTIRWSSDFLQTYAGWTLCGSVSAAMLIRITR